MLFRTGLYVKNHSVEKVQVAKTPIASYNGNVTGLYIPELIAYITAKQSGSGVPSPDNIRPIIGVSKCNVVRCGVNNFNEAWSAGYINASGTFVPTGAYSTTDYIPVKKGKTYYVKATVINADRANVAYYDASKTFIKLTSSAMAYNTQFTINEDCSYIRIILINTNTSRENFSFNYPSTATAYEAYNGNTYTIQLGDTYYGGSLDVTTGVLTINKALVDLGTLDYDYYVYSGVNGFYITNPFSSAKSQSTCQSSQYVYQPSDSTFNNDGVDCEITINYAKYIKIKDARYNDATQFKTAMNGVQLVYELATPITVQLTAKQVEQLLGQNNVWADTGDVEVKFYNVIK